MDPAVLQSLLEWIAAHPHAAGLAVFLIAFSESLAVVGLFVPGTLLMFGIGALVAVDALALGPTAAWAIAGAVAGDGASFWLGRHLREHLRDIWPFRRYPGALARSEAFFQRHGGKSILFGRFVGPVRPVIPAVAGMLGMSAWRFLAVNVISALLWAPAYLLPGMAVGASLALAAEVAARLVILLIGLALILWLVLWLLLRVLALLQARADAMLTAVETWARRHPRLGRVALGLIDPFHPQLRSLLILAVVLIAAAWAFFGLLAVVVGGPSPNAVDVAFFRVLQGLRTPTGDRLMVLVTELADWEIYVPITAVLLAWLALRRHWTAAGYWLAAVAMGALITHSLKWLVAAPRPREQVADLATFAFPSGHAAMSTVVYGFLAVLAAKELSPQRRWIPYVLAAALITPIALSRLYLGVHWLTDVLGGVALGVAWIALLGIAYRHHAVRPIPLRGLTVTVVATLLAAGTWHVSRHMEEDLQRHALRPGHERLALVSWWRSEWRELPAFRIDLRDRRRHPLTFQWAGSLDALRRGLEPRGWSAPVRLRVVTALRALNPEASIERLPVLPRVHDGRYEALVLIRPAEAERRRYILRLWRSRFVRADSGGPIWVGNVSHQDLLRPLGLLSYARTSVHYTVPLAVLRRDLAPFHWRQVHRPEHESERAEWNGDVVLAYPPSPG
ncbi:MAG: phosphatase PAP2 family protein [Gammaproteobacteria bacterium]|nr:phosphatase PAP2 family protein [Gammaproteobacteria bacterium]